VASNETLGLHGALRACHSFGRRRGCLGLAVRKREIAFRMIGGLSVQKGPPGVSEVAIAGQSWPPQGSPALPGPR
jgi:hypothetical protein